MSHTEQMREAFEAWLRTKPEARLWNTTDAMFTAYCAALSAAKDGGWLPIETAPKDGTEMLLLFGNAEYIFGKTHGRVRAACWTGSGASANWSLPYFKDNPPTAWQPLPAPPAQKDTT